MQNTISLLFLKVPLAVLKIFVNDNVLVPEHSAVLDKSHRSSFSNESPFLPLFLCPITIMISVVSGYQNSNVGRILEMSQHDMSQDAYCFQKPHRKPLNTLTKRSPSRPAVAR